MASGERLLEEQLVEAGNRLQRPPSSIDELLLLLDQVENFLLRVDQLPSKSMQTALSPSMKALVADELLRHPDVDVKVAVASCISEITRITAPDSPYDDGRMKDVFQLIVSSFQDLSDKSSRSYQKRTLILDTVAKVRSCVVMLDLECDGLIVEMFQHFLKTIRDYHPENIFSSMESIMTLVLEETDDITFELIAPILASVKRASQEVLPIACKLGERVFENCAIMLKPCLTQAKTSLGFSLDDYSSVVASICDGTTVSVGYNNDNACGDLMAEEIKLSRAYPDGSAQADENKLAVASSNEAAQDLVTKESVAETRPGDHSVNRSQMSVMSNGVAETGDEDISVDPESSKKADHVQQADQSVDTNVTSTAEPDDSVSEKIVKSESKSEKKSRNQGRKPNSLINSTEPSDSYLVDSDKEAERTADFQKTCSQEVCSSHSEDPSVEVAVPSENEKVTIQLSSPKALESEPMNVTSPYRSEGVPDEGRPKKVGRPKKKNNLIQEVAPSSDVFKAASEGVSDTEVKSQRRSGKRASAGSAPEEKTLTLTDASKSEVVIPREAKPLIQTIRKMDVRDNMGDESSTKKKDDGKRHGRVKSSIKDSAKEMVSSPNAASKLAKDGQLEETPKTLSKRKHKPDKEKASDIIEYGDDLVDCKVKIWWPKDQMFYEGYIDSFDYVKKRHKVLYMDGDEEFLDLRNERWKLVRGDSMPDGEQVTESRNPDPSLEMHKKKKAKANSEPADKQGKMEGLRNLEGVATKSGLKSRDDNKIDEKSKDNTSKSGGKSRDDRSGKSKYRSQKSIGKSCDASTTADKSKDVYGKTPKTTIESKQDTPQTATNSNGKAPKSGGKSHANVFGKVRSPSGKVKETKGTEMSPETVRAPERTKGQETDAKSGKQRRVAKS